MHVVRQVPRRMQRRMYSPLDRHVVNGVGLGEVDGLFNIGKMFSRLTHFTPSSFKLSNIMGAIGSVTAFTASGGLSTLLPKTTGAHSALMKDLGMATVAVAAVAGGAALLPAGTLTSVGGAAVGTQAAGSEVIGAATGQVAGGGFLSTVGSGISSVGSGLMNVVKALPFVGQMLTPGSGVTPQQDFGPAQPTAQELAAQAAYDQQVAQAQSTMYTPGGYNPNIPGVTPQYAGPVAPSMDTSYGDLRSPYTATTEDGQTQVQVDPATGQIVQAGVLPDWSWTTWLMIGGVTLAGLYVMRDDKK